jgi:hypothetical protein
MSDTASVRPLVRAGDQVPVDGRDRGLGQRWREPLKAVGVEQPEGDERREVQIALGLGERTLAQPRLDV